MNSGRPETMENLPALYTIFQGEVWSIELTCPPVGRGLVHRTHMSSCRVDKPSEIVDVGDKVWVKLIGREMKNDRIKYHLSMKVVNQGTGKDLDPNNVIIEQEERRRRPSRITLGQKITLEVPFAKDGFMQPGGTRYSLIPDEEEEKEETKSAEFEKPDPLRILPRKRKKKKKGSLSPLNDLGPLIKIVWSYKKKKKKKKKKKGKIQVQPGLTRKKKVKKVKKFSHFNKIPR
uniref:Zinc finger CCHC domain-containing protein 17 n=1 Tax=Sciurus vulgaris TaxID=55149 RepID=A0A8D2DFB9_SCIVU